MSGKGLNSTKEEEKKLVDRSSVLEWKVEELYTGKEKETFQKQEKSIRNRGLSMARSNGGEEASIGRMSGKRRKDWLLESWVGEW